jgi:hypothetical protein
LESLVGLALFGTKGKNLTRSVSSLTTSGQKKSPQVDLHRSFRAMHRLLGNTSFSHSINHFLMIILFGVERLSGVKDLIVTLRSFGIVAWSLEAVR